MQFDTAFIAATVAAAIGKRLTLENLRTVLMDHGPAGFEQFVEACRLAFVAQFAPARTSLAYMQKDKVPGVSTFYTYAMAVLKLGKRIEKGDAAAADELLALTPAKLTAAKGQTGAKPKKAAAQPEQLKAPELTPAMVLAALETMHSAGILSHVDYIRIQAIRPVHVNTPMADVVESTPALQA